MPALQLLRGEGALLPARGGAQPAAAVPPRWAPRACFRAAGRLGGSTSVRRPRHCLRRTWPRLLLPQPLRAGESPSPLVCPWGPQPRSLLLRRRAWCCPGRRLAPRSPRIDIACSASEDKKNRRALSDASGREQGRRLGRVFVSFVRTILQAVVSVVRSKQEVTAEQQAARVGSLVLFFLGVLCGLDAAQSAARRQVQRRILVPATQTLGAQFGRDITVKDTSQLAPWGVKLAGVRIGPGPQEESTLAVQELEVRLCPLQSVARQRPVIDIIAHSPTMDLVQLPDRTWCGVPQPPPERFRDILAERKSQSDAKKAARAEKRQLRKDSAAAEISFQSALNKQRLRDSSPPSGPPTNEPATASKTPALSSMGHGPASSAPAGAHPVAPSPPRVVLNKIDIRDGKLSLNVHGDCFRPREVREVKGWLQFKRNHQQLNMDLSGKVAKRDGFLDSDTTPGGGHVTYRAEIGLDNQTYTGVVKAKNLHAPNLEKLFELPMDVSAGRIDGVLGMEAIPNELALLYDGRVKVRNAAFSFDDSPAEFTNGNVEMIFDKQTLYLHNASGKFGAIPLRASGGLGLHPLQGEFHVSAQTTGQGVEATDLMTTMEARHPPFTAAGWLHGNVHVSGPLDAPLFQGRAWATAPPKRYFREIDRMRETPDEYVRELPAVKALLSTPNAVAAYDKIPFTSASAIYSYDAATENLELHRINVVAEGKGSLTGTATISCAPSAEDDPKALRAELRGVDLPADSVLHRYAPDLQRKAVHLGPVEAEVSVNGPALAPNISVNWIARRAEGSLANARGRVLMNREQLQVSSQAPSFDLKASLQTRYAALNDVRRAWTYEEVSSLAAPVIEGCDVDASVRGFDLMALSAQDMASLGATKLNLRGDVKYSGRVLPSEDGVTVGSHPTLVGEVSIAGVKLNQLSLAPGLKGSLGFYPSGILLEARGGQDEHLRLDLAELPTRGKLDGAGEIDSQSAEAPRLRTSLLGNTSGVVSLRQGDLRGYVRLSPSTVKVEVDNLLLDDLELGSLRGELGRLDVDLDFVRHNGSGRAVVNRPRYSGVQGNLLAGGYRWDNDVVTVGPIVLQQAESQYELQGVYTLPSELLNEIMKPDDADGPAQSSNWLDGKWEFTFNVPNAEITEALPAAQLLSRSSHREAVTRSKGIFLEGVRTFEIAAQKLSKQLELVTDTSAGGVQRFLPTAAETRVSMVDTARGRTEKQETGLGSQDQGSSFPLPSKQWKRAATSDVPFHGMQNLQGKWRGWVKVHGRGNQLDDKEGVRFALKGEDWEYGEYALQALRVAGKYNSVEGLKVDRLQVEADDASLRVNGSLLGEKQNASFALIECPVSLIEPLLPMKRNANGGDFPLSGTLYINGRLMGSKEAPEGQVKMQLIDGYLGGVRLRKAECSAEIKEPQVLTLSASVYPAASAGQVKLVGTIPLLSPNFSSSILAATGAAQPNDSKKKKAMSQPPLDDPPLSVDLRVQDSGMLVMNAFSPQIQWLHGAADLSIQVRGSIQDPLVRGVVQMHRASVDFPDILARPLTHLGGTVRFDSNVLRIERMEGRVGRKGYFRLDGALPASASVEKEVALTLVSYSDQEESPSYFPGIDIRMDDIEMKMKGAYTGLMNGQLHAGGSLMHLELGGALNFSHGSFALSGVTDERASSSSTAKSLASSLSAEMEHIFSRARKGVESVRKAYQDQNSPSSSELVCRSLRVSLGPEINFFYPFVLSFSVTGDLEMNGVAELDKIQPSGALYFVNGDVNLVATQMHLSTEQQNRAVFVPEQGLDPVVDVCLVGGNIQATISGRASAWQENLVVTAIGDGEDLSAAEGVDRLVSNLATSTLSLSPFLPWWTRVEAYGPYGPAGQAFSGKFRLIPNLRYLVSSAKVSNLLSLANMSLDFSYGDITAGITRKPMKDGQVTTQWSLLFPLNNKLRMQLNGTSAADSKVIFEYSAAGTGRNKADVAAGAANGSAGMPKPTPRTRG